MSNLYSLEVVGRCSETQIQVGESLRYLKVIYHPLYGMNNYVLIWGDWLSCDPHMIANHPIHGVIGYHVTLSEGHMIANHPI